MAKIALILKVMPEESDTDLDELEQKLEEHISPDEVEREEVAFGLEAIKASTVIDDEESSMEDAREQVESLAEVQTVEIESFNKI
jgi:elongation factor 1-beta